MSLRGPAERSRLRVIVVALADCEAKRTHSEATLHRCQERADQRDQGVGHLRRDRHRAAVADEPRLNGGPRTLRCLIASSIFARRCAVCPPKYSDGAL